MLLTLNALNFRKWIETIPSISLFGFPLCQFWSSTVIPVLVFSRRIAVWPWYRGWPFCVFSKVAITHGVVIDVFFTFPPLLQLSVSPAFDNARTKATHWRLVLNTFPCWIDTYPVGVLPHIVIPDHILSVVYSDNRVTFALLSSTYDIASPQGDVPAKVDKSAKGFPNDEWIITGVLAYAIFAKPTSGIAVIMDRRFIENSNRSRLYKLPVHASNDTDAGSIYEKIKTSILVFLNFSVY